MKAQFNHLLTTRHRRSRTISKVSSLIGFLLALGVTPSSHAQCRYSWEIIRGPFCGSDGGPASFAGSTLDDDGNAAGISLCFLGRTASSWPGSGDAIHLTAPAGVGDTFAFGMTDLNHIVGQSAVISNFNQPIATSWENGQGVLLPLLPGANTSSAGGINSSFQIAGDMNNTISGPLAAFRMDGAIHEILQLPLGPSAGANDVNEQGQIVGWMGAGVVVANAFLWENGIVTNLGMIPGGTSAEGAAINNFGSVVGNGRIPDELISVGSPHAWFWDGQTMFRLPEIPDHTTSRAHDLNDADQIVGHSRGDNGTEAVLWQDGQVFRLADLMEPPPIGIGTTIANSINNSGQILLLEGSAFLLTPIDSPPGDVNNNCMVDVEDLLILLGEWGKTLSIADVFPDGIVNVEDLLVVLGDWGLGGQS